MGHAKVSYVKKTFAKRSLISIVLSACALVLFLVGIMYSVSTNGQIPLNVAAVCFCSLLVACFSLLYALLSFLEREKKYILAKVSIGISGGLMLVWALLIIIGLKG